MVNASAKNFLADIQVYPAAQAPLQKASAEKSANGTLLPEQYCFVGATLLGACIGALDGTFASFVAGVAGGMTVGVVTSAAILFRKLGHAVG